MTKIIIPEELKIGANDVKIHESPTLLDDTEHYGEWNERRRDITLEHRLTDQHKEEVFLHEIFEAINGIYDQNLTDRQMTVLAVAFHQIIKDNQIFGGDV